MLVFPEPFLRSMGLGGALAVVTAMTASLTALPALLAVLGPRVNRGPSPCRSGAAAPARSRRASGSASATGSCAGPCRSSWSRSGCCSLAGVPFLHARLTNPRPGSLPPSFQTRITAEALMRDFAAGQSAPIQILVTLPASPVAPASLAALSAYVSRLRVLPGVRDVSSLVTLDPRIPAAGYAAFYTLPFNTAADAARAHFVHGNATLITVNYGGDSQSQAAQRLVHAIRAVPPPPGARALVGGDTAELVDHLASLRTHLPLAAALIMAATFVLLFVMLASILVPVKAIVLNVLSLAASFGLMTWVFQDGHLQNVLRFTSSGSLDATIPVLIFTLAFGLATDYEVFLVSRIKEEYDRTGDNTEAIATGVEKTGQIITSAALLLVVVVAAFGASQILQMKEIGVGLACAVAIDAAVVRTLLVPATMRVLGDLNWWLPPFLPRWSFSRH